MGREGELVGVVSPFHVKDSQNQPESVSYDLGGDNCWNRSSYDEKEKACNYMGSHKDIELF